MIESRHIHNEGLMLAQKQRMQITLDIECYDDLDVRDMNWRDLLQLEGDENVNVQVNSLDPYEMLY